MLPFHEALENFFHKNFSEEILRLPLESVAEDRHLTDVMDAVSTNGSQLQSQTSFQGGLNHKQSVSSFPAPTYASPPPMQVGNGGGGDLPPLSPVPYNYPGNSFDLSSRRNQTPLQRHLADLARYGMTGVSSGLGGGTNGMGSDGHSQSSLRDSSLVNLNGGAPGNSGTSIAPSQGGGSQKNNAWVRRFGSFKRSS